MVELLPAATAVGLNDAVAPAGRPVALKLTFCAEPLVTAVEIVDVPLEPCWTETLVGFAPIEKSFGGGAVSVSVEVPPAVTEVGLNDAVAPAGRPVALKVTFCADPLVTAVEMVDEPLEPCWTETLVGFALIEKSFAGAAGQPGSLNVPMRVLQLNEPFAGMYSFAYQKVQPSTGSMMVEPETLKPRPIPPAWSMATLPIQR